MEIQLTDNTPSNSNADHAKNTARETAVEALQNMKAEDIVILDVGTRASFTDYMILASGNSSRHVNAIAGAVLDAAKESQIPILGTEGQDVGEWVLVDLGDAIVHVMQRDIREYYELEKLWGEELSSD
jgi:ribosome-associated protein